MARNNIDLFVVNVEEIRILFGSRVADNTYTENIIIICEVEYKSEPKKRYLFPDFVDRTFQDINISFGVYRAKRGLEVWKSYIYSLYGLYVWGQALFGLLYVN